MANIIVGYIVGSIFMILAFILTYTIVLKRIFKYMRCSKIVEGMVIDCEIARNGKHTKAYKPVCVYSYGNTEYTEEVDCIYSYKVKPKKNTFIKFKINPKCPEEAVKVQASQLVPLPFLMLLFALLAISGFFIFSGGINFVEANDAFQARIGQVCRNFLPDEKEIREEKEQEQLQEYKKFSEKYVVGGATLYLPKGYAVETSTDTSAQFTSYDDSSKFIYVVENVIKDIEYDKKLYNYSLIKKYTNVIGPIEYEYNGIKFFVYTIANNKKGITYCIQGLNSTKKISIIYLKGKSDTCEVHEILSTIDMEVLDMPKEEDDIIFGLNPDTNE